MYDFVVVGAGPAGSRFARRAAEAGRDVVVLERGAVGEPLACSGHVSADLWEFTPPGARAELLENEIRGARFHVGGPESDGQLFYTRETISYVIDRVGLDRLLARTAEEAGVDLREGHSVLGVAEGEDHVDVTVRSSGKHGTDGGDTRTKAGVGGITSDESETANGTGTTTRNGTGTKTETEDGSRTETIRARMVVGCDGPVSTVRRECSLPEPGEKLQGLLGFSGETEPQEFVDVHLTAPSFFAWRIPRGEGGTEYGLAAPPGERASDLFDSFTAEYGVDVGEVHAGMIPISPPERVTGHRSLLVGDAAAQTKPFTGGGIVYGMTAADHTAKRVDPRDPDTLADYERAWRDDLSTEIRLGEWIRRAYSLPKPVQNVGLRALSGEIDVHMDKPTSVFSTAQLKAFLSRS
jgi:flavin-dependent dehydrogenase